ncbi:MAG: glycosyltransferase [Lachnospiraceae bacterium]|nr:glycosyltransferase [Lachnospiraceae bacterium]
MDNVAILIPMFNESKTIAKVIDDFYAILPENSNIYVYDNNSTDDSYGIVKKNGKAILRREFLQGKGNVVRRMFREIDAKIYVMVDADDTYNANDVNKLIEPIINYGADMVIGDRLSNSYFTENKRKFHSFGNVLMKNLINFFFNANVSDIMTGYRAFNRSFAKTYPCLSKGFEIETEMTIHAIDKNLNIKNVIIDYKDRPLDTPSKLNTISDGIKVILTFIKYFALYKPFIFFNIIALFLFILSTILLVPILIEYQSTHLVPRFPTLIVSGFLYIATLQCFFTGLTLELINKSNRQEFENKLISIKE